MTPCARCGDTNIKMTWKWGGAEAPICHRCHDGACRMIVDWIKAGDIAWPRAECLS